MAPGQDNVTVVILQQLPRKGQIKHLYMFNAMLRLDYWPCPLKTTKIIMILKPGKTPADVTLYRLISLLPTIAKVLEKLILNKINQEPNPQTWIADHQFGFRRAHLTIQQSHHIANTITNALSNKQSPGF
jgi:hypothetical protein